MGKIHNVEKMTDNRFVNLYHVDATSIHNTPVSYYVASRAKDVPSLKLKTGRNDPDGVIIYSIYGEKRDKVVLVRQYRYTLGDYIYEFPAGLVEPNEDFHEGAVREMYEETGLKCTTSNLNALYVHTDNKRRAVYFSFIHIIPNESVRIKLQPNETDDYRFISFEEFDKLAETAEFSVSESERYQLYRDMIKNNFEKI